MRLSRTLLASAASVLLAAASLATSVGTADAAPSWAPAATAAIHPGTMMYTEGAQCTANFVFTDVAGNVYVGYAAHCAGKGEATDTNGCNVDSVPLGTKVTFTNDGNLASEGTPGRHRHPGVQLLDHRRSRLGDHKDAEHLCLQRLRAGQGQRRPRRLEGQPPSVPFWGGPTGDRHPTAPQPATALWTYGNSSIRGGLAPLSPAHRHQPRVPPGGGGAPALHRDPRHPG